MFQKTFITSLFLLMLISSILSCDLLNRFRCNSNCDGYYICTDGIDTLYYCSEGQYCDMIGKNCSSEMNSCGPKGYEFKCSSEGIYPDPYDCTKFYVCGPAPSHPSFYYPDPVEGGTELKHSCPDGFAYNPGSTLCDFTLSEDICKYDRIPKCEVLFQTESLKLNQSIFYICITNSNSELIPQLFRCDSGYYNQTICQCSNSNPSLEKYSIYPCETQFPTSESTTEILSTMTEQQTTTDTTNAAPSTSISSTDQTTATTNRMDSTTSEETTTESTISISTTEQTTSTSFPTTTSSSATETEITTSVPTETTTHGEFICTSPGIYPDPYDCHSYYVCNIHLSGHHYTCSGDLFFNPETYECEEADECFPLPTQTTEIISTTQMTSTHSPFQCDDPGMYVDSYDCHAYYRCTVTGDVFHEWCDDGYYFSLDDLDCVKGDC